MTENTSHMVTAHLPRRRETDSGDDVQSDGPCAVEGRLRGQLSLTWVASPFSPYLVTRGLKWEGGRLPAVTQQENNRWSSSQVWICVSPVLPVPTGHPVYLIYSTQSIISKVILAVRRLIHQPAKAPRQRKQAETPKQISVLVSRCTLIPKLIM